MRAVLHDLQDDSKPAGYRLDHRSVARTLEQFRGRAPFIAEVRSKHDHYLTVGIADDHGFVQHSGVDGQAPYLVAYVDGAAGGTMAFLISDTPSEIPGKYKLSRDAFVSVISFYIETGNRSPAYRWDII